MIMDGEEMGLSERYVDGASAPKVFGFLFSALPEGEYQGRAVLERIVGGKAESYSAVSGLLIVR